MFRFAATSALALMAGAAPVLADVTPAQVWENLQKSYSSLGYQVAGRAEDAGGVLTVTDAVFSAPAEGGATTVTIPSLIFRETGDAKVRMVMDGDIAINSRFTVPAPAEPAPDAPAGNEAAPDATPAEPRTVEVTMNGTVKAPGNETLVSGTPEDMLYEYAYPSLAVDLAVPVDPESDATMPMTATFTDVTGTQRSTAAGQGTDTTFDMKASGATMTFAADTPQTPENPGGTVKVDVALTDLAGAGTVSSPGQATDLAADLARALKAGFDLKSTLSFASLKADFDFAGTDDAGQNQTGKGTITTGATEAAIGMSATGLAYKGSVEDTKAEITSSALPLPISYAAERSAFDMLLPVSKGDAAQPFKLAYALEGLTFADGIWNLFDPTSQLPRDPASLSVDLAGDAMVAVDLFDPALQQPGAAVPETPFAPQSLTINKIALDAVGAKADISGALEFGDTPNEPVGKLNGTFDGVNGLLDKLVAMGFVPQEQMMGMRMMLAMFAKPVDGQTDQLTSEIEFREGGSIFANGQQVK